MKFSSAEKIRLIAQEVILYGGPASSLVEDVMVVTHLQTSQRSSSTDSCKGVMSTPKKSEPIPPNQVTGLCPLSFVGQLYISRK